MTAHGQEDGQAHGQGRRDEHGHGHAEAASAGPADWLDLEATVLRDYWQTVLDRVAAAAAGRGHPRVLDLGAGTGVGTVGLASRLPGAEVVALDVDAGSLERIRTRADRAGVTDRVRVVGADLDLGWPETAGLEPLDLTWASMSLHHMADPGRVLRDVLAATCPGGLLAVAEVVDSLRFLPEQDGDFEERVVAEVDRAHTEQMPTLRTPWAPRLTDAGWTVVEEVEVPIDVDGAGCPELARFAHTSYARLADGLGDRLSPADAAAVADLVDDAGPGSLLRRGDLRARGTRRLTIARR